MSNEFNYKKPSEEQVRAALARLGNLSLRRAFYSKLNNPYWIAVLAKQDVFANPPETKVKPDGSVQSDPWPEIDYLARMASIASKEVADVLEPIADSNNDWVRRGIVEAATVLDPADLARLVYKMEKWPDEKLGNFRIDPRDIARVIIRLLEGDQHGKGMKLAHAYFCPRPLSTASKYGTEPSAGIEPYWYKECLPSISFALGSSRIPTLVRWLKSYLKHANASTGKRSFDIGNIWRPSIRTAGEYHFREIGNSLIDAVREALMDSVQTDLKPLRLHLKDDQPLIRRIALSVLADSIENIDDKSAKHVSELTQIDRDLLDVAVLVLNDESFIDSNYRSEYLPFIRACLSLRGIINVTPFFKYIKAGPLSIRDERRELYAQEGDTPEEADIRREIYKKHWQHKMLTLVGAEALPKDLQEMLAALNAEYGVLEVKDEVENFEVLREFTSPISIDEMCAMSDDELLKHLRDWHPDPDVWAGPTHEYQGRVLTEAITKQPNRFDGIFEDLKTLRPTYIRAIVSGWRALIESNNVMPWDAILPFCEWVVGLSDEIKLTIEGDEFDDDSDYQYLKSQVLNLLDSGLAVRPTTDNPGIGEKNIPRVQTLLANYADNPDPTPEHEAQYGGDNMDPLTLSLNTVRPVAIRALIKLVYGFPDNPAAVDALAILNKHVAGRDPSLAVTAAIGEGTGRLYDSARPWIEERAVAIFGERLPTTEYQQVALSTTLAVYSFHQSLFELLRGSILLMLKEMPDVKHVSGWSDYRRTFDQLIGDWIMIGIIRGHLDYDDEIVELWFSRADADLRGNVQGNLARLMTDNSEIPDNILERMADLWNRRIVHVKEHPEDAVELKGIYWLVDSDRYEVEWWLPRLEYVSSVVPGFQTRGMLSDKLVKASLVDPDTSLKVVENLILGNIGSGSFHFEEYDLINNAVPKIIANALNTKKPDIEQRATYLMNQLGIAGYTDLKKRVEKLRESEIKDD